MKAVAEACGVNIKTQKSKMATLGMFNFVRVSNYFRIQITEYYYYILRRIFVFGFQTSALAFLAWGYTITSYINDIGMSGLIYLLSFRY